MEKLEKKIYEMVYQSGDEASENTASNLASEVKDIAIAFANFRDDYINDLKQGFASARTKDELFRDFIAHYYK